MAPFKTQSIPDAPKNDIGQSASHTGNTLSVPTTNGSLKGLFSSLLEQYKAPSNSKLAEMIQQLAERVDNIEQDNSKKDEVIAGLSHASEDHHAAVTKTVEDMRSQNEEAAQFSESELSVALSACERQLRDNDQLRDHIKALSEAAEEGDRKLARNLYETSESLKELSSSVLTKSELTAQLEVQKAELQAQWKQQSAGTDVVIKEQTTRSQISSTELTGSARQSTTIAQPAFILMRQLHVGFVRKLLDKKTVCHRLAQGISHGFCSYSHNAPTYAATYMAVEERHPTQQRVSELRPICLRFLLTNNCEHVGDDNLMQTYDHSAANALSVVERFFSHRTADKVPLDEYRRLLSRPVPGKLAIKGRSSMSKSTAPRFKDDVKQEPNPGEFTIKGRGSMSRNSAQEIKEDNKDAHHLGEFTIKGLASMSAGRAQEVNDNGKRTHDAIDNGPPKKSNRGDALRENWCVSELGVSERGRRSAIN
ncbi:MAG: hypothetical protein M1831_004604 [Alyxoria varia]|nr:MAG: hypothetical protein M1831_004604 [Alyxoria varia]